MKTTMLWRGEKELYKTLIKIERNVDKSTGEFLQSVAEWLRNDIRSHWSTRSPSSWGSAPAIDTGNLDSSVIAEPMGRSSGQFATTSDAKAWYVRVNTSEGTNPDDRGNYAQALEDKSYLNRPFMRPAIERLNGVFASLAKRDIKL